ncbi:hypothetical protein CIT26_09020 [Mesorhizobium temperatum]|uniref:Uncharacterized protein n=1 Tax=Mesorhizobium temperatum TaxID=241416 RepID=A0A271LQ87_9HYPH|nr:hypothetical protein CIT26_09020 [Mesorhizobium temperatum]
MREDVDRFVSVFPNETPATIGAPSRREVRSPIVIDPLAISTLQISSIDRSSRRADVLTKTFDAVRRSKAHRAQKCCGIRSVWSKDAIPLRQAGHRSRRPRPCTKHEMRVGATDGEAVQIS